MCGKFSITSRERRGSILITVLGLLGVLAVLTMALLGIAGEGANRAWRLGGEVRLRWLATGELEALVSRLENGRELLVEKQYTVKTDDGEIRVTIEKKDKEGREYMLSATAVRGGLSRTSRRGVEAFYPSDYALTVETNWHALSRFLPAAIVGSAFINGDCVLAVTEDGPLDLTGDQEGRRPLWSVAGAFRPLSLDGAGKLQLFRSRIHPFSEARPWSREGRMTLLAGPGADGFTSGKQPEIEDRLPGKVFRFPEFKQVYAALYARSEPLFRYMQGDRTRIPEFSFVNPKLTAKDLLTVGDGNSFIFDYTPPEREISMIYFRKVVRGEPVDGIRIDPVADADSIGTQFFNARMGKLHLAAGESKMYLQFDKDSLKVLGRIYYGTIHRSYCSVDHPFSRFYINTLSEIQDYKEDVHYKVNYREKYIEFTDSGLMGEHYSFLNERGDGQRLGFRVPVDLQYQYVYVDGVLDEDVRRDGDILLFGTPPPPNAAIGFLLKVPRIFGERQVPRHGVGIFADKLVTALRIDLGELQHYPSKGVIVSDRPLYVTGRAAYPVTIVSTEDIYIDKINSGLADPRPVGIVSGKAVWVYNPEMKTNMNLRVFVHSQAGRIFTTHSIRPGSGGAPGEAGRIGVLVGSVQLAGRLANGYDAYPKGIEEAHIFSPEPFFSVQYRYDPYFADPANLPPGISPLVRLLWWRP